MKKFVSTFSIVMLVVNVLILGVSVLALTQPEAIGSWIVSVYEEITSDLGHTVPGMYARLSLIASIAGCVALIASTILCEISCVYICKHCGHVESDEESVDAEEEIMEDDMKLSREEKLALKEQKRKEKKAAKVAKAVAKGLVEGVAEAVVEKKEEKVDKKAEFLNSLKRK